MSIVDTAENDDNDLKKQNISEFISLITQVYSASPQLIHSKKRSIHLSASTENTSKFLSRTFQDEEKFLNLLRDMVKEMDNMQGQLLSYVDTYVLHDTTEQSSKPHKSLHHQFSKFNLLQEAQKTETPASVHLDYSVVEDEKKTLLENKKLKSKLEYAEETLEILEQKYQDQEDEIEHLKDSIKSVSVSYKIENLNTELK